MMLFILASCGNPETKIPTGEQAANSGVYSYVTEGDYAKTYYVVDFDKYCVFSFYADENDDNCFELPIEEGDLKSGLRGSIS